jgi:acetyl-CoA acyltransferase 2
MTTSDLGALTIPLSLQLEDTLWTSLTDAHSKTPMGITAENLAEKYGISREEVDAFALRSQTNWKKAQDAGVFTAEIAPVKVKVKRVEVELSVDEHPKPKTTAEGLAKLAPVFKKGGTVTAGTASVSAHQCIGTTSDL